jgi:hypothetical protein
MQSKNGIESSLFDWLDRSCDRILSKDPNDQTVAAYDDMTNMITAFLKNFFIQYFGEGYGIQIDGISGISLAKVKNHFGARKLWVKAPQQMISAFDESARQIVTLEEATYSYPPNRQKVVSVLTGYVPMLLNAFSVEHEKIKNSDVVMQRVTTTLAKIKLVT